ncbi:MAG: glutaredoxin family protein [Austwickia sp.]|jgi:glutaredoxin|nr:MAG: glutaredoxin family protein [Austwickia sp.]
MTDGDGTQPRAESSLRLEIVTIPDCHLCDQARAALADLARRRGEAWVERDLTEQPAREEIWWEQVPLVLVDGQVVCYWRFDEAAVAAALDRR